MEKREEILSPGAGIYNHAVELMVNKHLDAKATVKALMEDGHDAESANTVVRDIQRQVIKSKKADARKDMFFGALWFIGGTIATIAEISFLFYALMLFGGIQFFRGLMNGT
ncbi:hypothetical protein [Flavihumibacter petaseus]|uniref:Uncharacterized protein n=1 Tax=Flavihumibacter petaseus NBRC 106054 TaxID=1220578 RepID=A0A0E9N3G3_9BACT|nr:hypothetical protein [Flavihumibacter petaseus]GAO44221.1 hypothetical protein FPE01S_03_02590 [Flavihumibacter petaseus NBRC 106054]